MPDSKLLVIHGPNLNLLGSREPDHYGVVTLAQINAGLTALAESQGVALEIRQSNAEYELIDTVQAAPSQNVDFIVINPAALTHTSIGLRDALQAVRIPFIEIHLSNVHAREDFRRKSYFSDIAAGVITGLGPVGYELALRAAVRYLDEHGDDD